MDVSVIGDVSYNDEYEMSVAYDELLSVSAVKSVAVLSLVEELSALVVVLST